MTLENKLGRSSYVQDAKNDDIFSNHGRQKKMDRGELGRLYSSTENPLMKEPPKGLDPKSVQALRIQKVN